MASNEQIEIYKALRESQSKYTYFLLASVGAAIGFAITQTKAVGLSFWQVPLGMSILFWGISFYSGCRQITHVNSLLYTNSEMLRIKSGRHPDVGNNPLLINAAYQGVKNKFEVGNNMSNTLMKRQLRTFIIGSVLFIVWHVFEMLSRTATSPEIIDYIKKLIS